MEDPFLLRISMVALQKHPFIALAAAAMVHLLFSGFSRYRMIFAGLQTVFKIFGCMALFATGNAMTLYAFVVLTDTKRLLFKRTGGSLVFELIIDEDGELKSDDGSKNNPTLHKSDDGSKNNPTLHNSSDLDLKPSVQQGYTRLHHHPATIWRGGQDSEEKNDHGTQNNTPSTSLPPASHDGRLVFSLGQDFTTKPPREHLKSICIVDGENIRDPLLFSRRVAKASPDGDTPRTRALNNSQHPLLSPRVSFDDSDLCSLRSIHFGTSPVNPVPHSVASDTNISPLGDFVPRVSIVDTVDESRGFHNETHAGNRFCAPTVNDFEGRNPVQSPFPDAARSFKRRGTPFPFRRRNPKYPAETVTEDNSRDIMMN